MKQTSEARASQDILSSALLLRPPCCASSRGARAPPTLWHHAFEAPLAHCFCLLNQAQEEGGWAPRAQRTASRRDKTTWEAPLGPERLASGTERGRTLAVGCGIHQPNASGGCEDLSPTPPDVGASPARCGAAGREAPWRSQLSRGRFFFTCLTCLVSLCPPLPPNK